MKAGTTRFVPEDSEHTLALGRVEPRDSSPGSSYNTVGVGSQILRDLGVGKIRLMGAPIKYNGLSGFGLEVTEFLDA